MPRIRAVDFICGEAYEKKIARPIVRDIEAE
jgi:hypothetical protein